MSGVRNFRRGSQTCSQANRLRQALQGSDTGLQFKREQPGRFPGNDHATGRETFGRSPWWNEVIDSVGFLRSLRGEAVFGRVWNRKTGLPCRDRSAGGSH